jgi:cyclopropane fatty-acyl-phospholipid synthase-like methyltransferase
MLPGSAEDYVRTTYGRWASGPHARLWARHKAQVSVGPEAVRHYRLYLKACEAIFVRGAARLYRIGQERRDKPLTLLR